MLDNLITKLMRICDINGWAEKAKLATFWLPITEEGLEEEDTINHTIAAVTDFSLERFLTMQDIRNLQEEVRLRFLRFNIYL